MYQVAEISSVVAIDEIVQKTHFNFYERQELVRALIAKVGEVSSWGGTPFVCFKDGSRAYLYTYVDFTMMGEILSEEIRSRLMEPANWDLSAFDTEF